MKRLFIVVLIMSIVMLSACTPTATQKLRSHDSFQFQKGGPGCH